MWLRNDPAALPAVVPRRVWQTVAIAVPARDEAATIIACLTALDGAAGHSGANVTVVVSANNCCDLTAILARSFRPRATRVIVEEVLLPAEKAHAGGARRLAMDRAATIAGANGIVMTTDADSCVDVAWIAANLAEIDQGADAVAGTIAFDVATRSALPALDGRDAEWQLAALHARLEHLLDPRAHDPWPRHIWAWGASLAMTAEAYRTVGGVPVIPLAEDRALADAIDAAGLRLRHSLAPLVYTSARRSGRAPGGFADLINSYVLDPNTPCDAALEPTKVLLRRLITRARLRATAGAGFATRWAALQATSPKLGRQRLHPRSLPAEIARAQRAIVMLERRAPHRSDNHHAEIAPQLPSMAISPA